MAKSEWGGKLDLSSTHASEKKGKRGSRVIGSGTGRRKGLIRLNAKIPEDLYWRLKERQVRERKDLRVFLIELIERELGKKFQPARGDGTGEARVVPAAAGQDGWRHLAAELPEDLYWRLRERLAEERKNLRVFLIKLLERELGDE